MAPGWFPASRVTGSQLVAVPVAALNAAPPPRATLPLTVVNAPPAYTVVPTWVSAATEPSRFGFQLEGTPDALTAASRLRLYWMEPELGVRLVKAPPRYTVVPIASSASTSPLGFGSHAVR